MPPHFYCKKKGLYMKKKREFKKIALTIILIFCIGFLVWSYILASIGSNEVNSQISEALVHTVLGSFVAYVLASYSEKNSRNKYGVNIDKGGEKGDN